MSIAPGTLLKLNYRYPTSLGFVKSGTILLYLESEIVHGGHLHYFLMPNGNRKHLRSIYNMGEWANLYTDKCNQEKE